MTRGLIEPDLQTLYDALMREQTHLWGDLDEALRMAANNVWSVGMDNKCYRILHIAKIVGPTHWGNVQWRILGSGIWNALLEVGGIPHENPSIEEWMDLDERMVNFGGTAEELTQRYSETVAQITSGKMDFIQSFRFDMEKANRG